MEPLSWEYFLADVAPFWEAEAQGIVRRNRLNMLFHITGGAIAILTVGFFLAPIAAAAYHKITIFLPALYVMAEQGVRKFGQYIGANQFVLHISYEIKSAIAGIVPVGTALKNIGSICVSQMQQLAAYIANLFKMNNFGTLSRAREFGIHSYNTLRQRIAGTGLHAHHLIEQRLQRTTFLTDLAVAVSQCAAFWRDVKSRCINGD